MAIKKRKTAEEHVASTPVKHVVEVVEEETSISSIAEAPPQEAAQTPHEASAESAQTIPRESELQEEAVVAELFKRPKPPAVMPEIAMHTESRSKVPGAASKMKAFLEDKGYTVADVANADDYTYDKTEVQVQEGKEAYQKLLIDDLEDTYALATDAAALASTVSYDARVIVGKE
ncbi:LytR C-terminal domain-containing protein [Candidatus Gottesmanbacteria bacterium]|nr:LytR C-terminal domain-containing protein [Candidatus Gottesmanbacteria bacterium]